ncbi:MAG: hypothetical protein DDG60_07470 [Anaerolineae bacterium]|nr:MAG: hypothetical protein DDG60_07470 [Anaerolineae bacterium]
MELPAERLKVFRAKTFRLRERITTPQQALEWVNQRGFVFFWPIKGITFPSLWVAVAGDRPVADEHDDPGHITWRWKDEALDKRIWYYAKVLRRKATLISLEIAPYFYALSENYGAPHEDHWIAYREGRMTLAAKQVYEALLNGPLDTIELRRKAHLTSPNSEAEFNRALETLQADFKILPIGIAQAGAWKYAFVYTITAYHYPDLPEKARTISEAQARETLLNMYFRSVGAAQVREVEKLFGWGHEVTQRSLLRLLNTQQIVAGIRLENQTGEWMVLAELL